jgi:hypothetical protein
VVTAKQKKFTSIALLSIIIPLSLLVTFKLTGVITEPKAETITMDPVTWTYVRPTEFKRIDTTVRNSYENDGVTIEFDVYLYDYIENSFWPFNVMMDRVEFTAYAEASATQGYFSSIVMKHQPRDSDAITLLDSNDYALETHNSTITRVGQTGTNASAAYLMAQSSSSSSSISTTNYWFFSDDNIEDHQVDLTLEISYIVGAKQLKIVLPLVLVVSIPA